MNRAEKRRLQKQAAKAANKANPAVIFNDAVRSHQTGDLASAEKLYSKVLKLDPGHVDAMSNRGLALMGLGHFEDAVTSFEKALAISPNAPDLYFNLGTALDELWRYGDATDAYLKCLERAPGYAPAHYNLAGIKMSASQPLEAVKHYKDAVAADPGYVDAHFGMGVALQEAELFEEAIESYRLATVYDNNHAGAHANMGFSLKELGRYEEAHEAYRKAIAIDPDNSKILTTMCDVYLAEGDPATGLELCDTFLDTHPGDVSAMAFRAAALNDLGDHDELRTVHNFDKLIRPRVIDVPDGYADLSAFNAALVEHVLNHPTLVEAPASYSTMNGRHTSELLTGHLGPMADFEKVIRREEQRYREEVPVDPSQSWLAQRPERTKLNCWSVVMNSQGYQLSHIHPSGWLSGVYYPRLPDVIDDDDPNHEGWIEFGRTTDNYSGKSEPDVRMYKPREGLMVLFPAYFYHRTIPFNSDQLRFSIAFDICPAG